VSRLRGLLPWLSPYAQYLYDTAQAAGLRPRITSVYRTPTQQAYLYQRYRRGLSQLPAAPPGRCLHQYRRAFDIVSDDPAALGDLWQRMGGRWYASDPVHYEA
jgi:hypothetical protein